MSHHDSCMHEDVMAGPWAPLAPPQVGRICSLGCKMVGPPAQRWILWPLTGSWHVLESPDVVHLRHPVSTPSACVGIPLTRVRVSHAWVHG